MDATQFQRIAKALADPRRFEIFEETEGPWHPGYAYYHVLSRTSSDL